jgi:hypothetical protein
LLQENSILNNFIINLNHEAMKKAFFGFIAFILFIGMASGQTYYSTASEAIGIKSPGSNESRAGIDCPPNTLYSHIVNYQTAFTSWDGYFTVYDEIGSTPTGQVGEITFFGVFDATPGRNFQISFYQDNAGLPGAQIATYTTFIAGTNTGQILQGYYPIYSYYYALPTPLNLVAGDWVAVLATDGPDPWYWCTASGGNGCVDQVGYGYRCDFGDVAFCLGRGVVTPLSSWALLFGGILIAGFIFLRYRRMI